jgi:hypothetical protein
MNSKSTAGKWESDGRRDDFPVVSPADVIADYVQAGEARRFHLWMSHRDLRPVFDKIADSADTVAAGDWFLFDLPH